MGCGSTATTSGAEGGAGGGAAQGGASAGNGGGGAGGSAGGSPACDFQQPCVTDIGGGPFGTEPSFDCAATPVCPTVSFVGGDGPEPSPPFSVGGGDVGCLLAGLRDGVEGAYAWHVSAATGPMLWVARNTVTIGPDRGGLFERVTDGDLGVGWHLQGPFELRDTAHFEACLMLTDDNAIYTCLNDFATGDCAPQPSP